MNELTWQQKSHGRGVKLLIYSMPLLLVAFYASSQIPRVPSSVLFETKGKSHQLGGSFVIKGNSPKVPIRIIVNAQKYKGPKVKLRYELRQDKDLVRSKTMITHLQSGGGRPISLDGVFPVEGGKRYRIHARVSEGSLKKRGVSSWKLIVERNPESSELWLYRYLELLFYPSLSFVLLGLVMMFVPKYLSSS